MKQTFYCRSCITYRPLTQKSQHQDTRGRDICLKCEARFNESQKSKDKRHRVAAYSLRNDRQLKGYIKLIGA